VVGERRQGKGRWWRGKQGKGFDNQLKEFTTHAKKGVPFFKFTPTCRDQAADDPKTKKEQVSRKLSRSASSFVASFFLVVAPSVH
jgi:hypothetical protein